MQYNRETGKEMYNVYWPLSFKQHVLLLKSVYQFISRSSPFRVTFYQRLQHFAHNSANVKHRLNLLKPTGHVMHQQF